MNIFEKIYFLLNLWVKSLWLVMWKLLSCCTAECFEQTNLFQREVSGLSILPDFGHDLGVDALGFAVVIALYVSRGFFFNNSFEKIQKGKFCRTLKENFISGLVKTGWSFLGVFFSSVATFFCLVWPTLHLPCLKEIDQKNLDRCCLDCILLVQMVSKAFNFPD